MAQIRSRYYQRSDLLVCYTYSVGQPIAATITVTPGNHSVTVRADGSFDLELAPGTYTVKFQHEDYATQRRTIRLQDRGVVILNIALIR